MRDWTVQATDHAEVSMCEYNRVDETLLNEECVESWEIQSYILPILNYTI